MGEPDKQPVAPAADNNKQGSELEWQLRKYLLLLASLVATVTYVAGMDPPGGVWLETKDGHRTGSPILPATRHIRYTLFYYFNATAFAASLVVIILLMFVKKGTIKLKPLRGVMVLDVLCLMVAYVAGSSRGLVITIYASVLCTVVFSFVVVITGYRWMNNTSDSDDDGSSGDDKLLVKQRSKVLMLLAMFVTTITYTAALNPPGGFWEEAPEEGHHASHRAGDPILLKRHTGRFLAFLICNTTAFAASLVIITLLLSRRLWHNAKKGRVGLYAGIVVALLGLLGAYAAGSGRETGTTVYVLCLVGIILVYIAIFAVFEITCKSGKGYCFFPLCRRPSRTNKDDGAPTDKENPVDKARSLILLLATLAATITYQAGINPPGGVRQDGGDGFDGGDLILLATHARRYKVFYYCNSASFVASIVVVMMLQSSGLVGPRALQAAVILDLFGLMGAYAAGSCRGVLTSIYVFALAAVVFVGVSIHILTLPKLYYSAKEREDIEKGRKENQRGKENGKMVDIDKQGTQKKENEKKRKLLLLLAILAVSITYQAGLIPPGKFWLEHGDEAHRVGDPVLADNYPLRYKAFFYCNATSFMVSVAVILILVGRDLSNHRRRYWWPLYACMAAGLVGLMGAYAAGTTRRVRRSIYVFALVGAVLLFAFLHINVIQTMLRSIKTMLGSIKDSNKPHSDDTTNGKDSNKPHAGDGNLDEYRMSKYLLLLGILAASVTYQAGLDPPGGVWSSDGARGDGHAAGDPVLRDVNRIRYHAFFYSNSACFVASVVVIVLLLQGMLPKGRWTTPFRAIHMVVVLDLLGLLVAYAAGSSRDWGTSGYVLAMAAAVLAYVGIYVVLSCGGGDKKSGPESSGSPSSHLEASSPGGGDQLSAQVNADK